jgi:hypothetical protein
MLYDSLDEGSVHHKQAPLTVLSPAHCILSVLVFRVPPVG